MIHRFSRRENELENGLDFGPISSQLFRLDSGTILVPVFGHDGGVVLDRFCVDFCAKVFIFFAKTTFATKWVILAIFHSGKSLSGCAQKQHFCKFFFEKWSFFLRIAMAHIWARFRPKIGPESSRKSRREIGPKSSPFSSSFSRLENRWIN